MKTEIAIIGGGLSGLSLARLLHQTGHDFQLFEARARWGGRIDVLQHDGEAFDLGPSWFWRGQSRMAALADEFGIEVFQQHATGDLCFEDASGNVQRGAGFSSMEGSLRLKGGMMALIDGLLETLPAHRLHLDQLVESLNREGTVQFSNGQTCTAKHIVMALPPRLTSTLLFAPALTSEQIQTLKSVPTWMAGHAKFVAIYDKPFWREAGFSGDATSSHGPMVEIHDASGADGTQGALFGFLGVPAANREKNAAALGNAALAQLSRIFGPKALSPEKFILKDWAFEPQTAMSLDHQPPSYHPAYGLPNGLENLWGGRLHLCSTEVAPEMGGYLEGALAAAQETANVLLGESVHHDA